MAQQKYILYLRPLFNKPFYAFLFRKMV